MQKSPFTDGEVLLEKEKRTLTFRKETFEVVYHYFKCIDTGETFTTTDIDTLNINQVYHKYRAKYGIPFTDEIKAIREKYGLSAAKMSDVLGLGANVYRQYEAGDMPSVATGRLIRLAEDESEFKKLVEMSRNVFEDYEYEKVLRKINHAKGGWGQMEAMWKGWLLGNTYPNLLNGYRVASLERLGNMVRYFAAANKPYTTALNKLMFYADFGHFKKYGTSISGIHYKAIQRGPVPENYGGLYNHLVNTGFVSIEETDFGEFVGDRFVAESHGIQEIAEKAIFTESELAVIMAVSSKFKGLSTKQIVDFSHEEPAWKGNIDDKNRISYEYSFILKHFTDI